MGQNDASPRFRFDTPPPFNYEEFRSQHLTKVLAVIAGPAGDFLKQQTGDQAEFLSRFLYVMIVTKLQHPEVGMNEMMYNFYYGMVRYYLDQGTTPEEARDQLSQVPWDTLPGMDIYDSETTNAVAKRAFADAVAGRFQSSLH